MSLVCAVPKRGIVYFASDTQTTCADYGFNIASDRLAKVQAIGSFVVGYVGNVSSIEIGISILEELKGRHLTKKLIANEYIPRFIAKARRLGLINKESNEDFRENFPQMLIAEGGKLYEVSASVILRLETPDSLGSGSSYMLNSLFEEIKSSEVNDRLAEAISKYGSKNIYVNKTVALINTKTLKLEVRNDSSI